jgi:triosephosphate isomerase
MRKQIAAANWKMNKTLSEGEQLLKGILGGMSEVKEHQQVVFAIPFPYLLKFNKTIGAKKNTFVAAQNCHHKVSGAYTGEVSVDMLESICIKYCIVGHSERREYFSESNSILADKVNLCLSKSIVPIFCCGELLNVREAGIQNEFVQKQLQESLFHLDAGAIQQVIIAYEPIWAIGTGKTASSDQAQDMHKHIRSVLAKQFEQDVAGNISILYGGSVKGSNAKEIFSQPDVDGGLIGGASLVEDEFLQIIQSLK